MFYLLKSASAATVVAVAVISVACNVVTASVISVTCNVVTASVVAEYQKEKNDKP